MSATSGGPPEITYVTDLIWFPGTQAGAYLSGETHPL